MSIIQRFTTYRPPRASVKKALAITVISVSLLLCGFSNWFISFTASVIFPVEEAVDLDMIQGFDQLVEVEDLLCYINEPQIAEQIASGVSANLAGDVYRFDLPELRSQSVGERIVRIILDRLFF